MSAIYFRIHQQKTRFLFLVFIFFGFSLNHANASHAVGSDITYACTGTPGVYTVYLNLYRDCAGIQLCSNCPSGLSPSCSQTVDLLGASGSCNGTSFGSATLTVITSISGFDVIQLCAASTSICSNCGTRTAGSFSPGIEVYKFSGTVNLSALPASCCMVSVGFSVCCRNAAITTLANPGSLSFFSEATINRCASPCNSAPAFTNDPVAITCAGQDFSYNLGAIDPDGDSLSYSFGQSLVSRGSPAAYVSPYSPTVPLPYLGAPTQSPPALPPVGINIDPVTGDIRFRPLGVFVANLIVEVKQWAYIGGVPTLMGITRRDIQFYSSNCPANNPPRLFTYDANAALTTPQPNFSYSICAGQQLCMYITAWDNTAGWDTTDMTWNSPPVLVSNGATFVKAYNPSTRGTIGPRLDSMKFCWTPPASMARNLPYYFVVTAKDRACPLPARVTRSFSIIVRRIPLAVIDVVDKNCGYYDFAYTLTNSVPLNPAYTRFYIETGPNTNTYTTITGNSVSNHRFTQGGLYRIRLRLTTTAPPSPNGCPNDSITTTLFVPNPVKVSMRDSANCFGVPVVVRAHGRDGIPFGQGYRYTFYAGPLATTNVIRPLNVDSNVIINPVVSGTTTNYKVVIFDLNGCRDSTVFNILTRNLPLKEMVPSMRLCYGTSDTLDAGSNNGTIGLWRWSKSPVAPVLSDTISQKIIPADSGRYIVRKTDGFGCVNSDTAMVYVNPQVPVSAGPNRIMCFSDAPINIVATGTSAAIDSFQWRAVPIVDPTIVLSRSATLSTGPSVNTTYQVTGYITYGGITCSNVDSMDVVVKALPIITRPTNFSLCRNTNFVLLPTIVSTNKPGQISSAWTYAQYPAALNGNQVIVNNLQNLPAPSPANPAGNIIKLSVTDLDGCKIKDSVVISLFPVPVINAGPRRKFCDFAAIFNITPGSQLYTPNGGPFSTNELWFGNGIYKPVPSSNKYSFNPRATDVRTDTNIITYAFNATFPLINPVVFNPAITGFTAPSPTGGCLSSDTVIFEVIKTPKLETGLANPVCKSGDSVFLDTYMQGGSTTAVNPATSYWYIGAPDQAYRPALSRGRVFLPKHPVIETYTKQYVLVYADTATTCRVADTTTIQVNENPAVSIDYTTPSDSAVCITRGNLYFVLQPSGASPDTGTTLSSTPAVGSFDVSTGKFNFAGAGNGLYNVKYHYTDPATYCDNRASINIRLQEPPQLAISPDQTVCEYDAVFNVTVITAPSAPYNIDWKTLDGDNSKVIGKGKSGMDYTATASDIQRGKVTFKAMVIDTGVCNSLSAQTVYTINHKPNAQFVAAPDKGCVDDRYGLVLTPVYTAAPSGVSNATYKWFQDDAKLGTPENGTPYSDSVFSQSFSKPGKHNIYLLVESKGCLDTAVIPVEAWATPVAAFYTNPKSTTIARPYFDFFNTSTIADGSTLANIWKLPPSLVGGPVRLMYDKDLKAIPFIADTSACIPVMLTVVSDNGCFDSVQNCVTIEPDITVFIPNAFRPKTGTSGGSDVDCLRDCNRTFKIAATGYEKIEIYVFNRWGQMVFKSNDANDNGWDGTDMTTKQECQQDAYIYQINALSFNGKKYTYSGSITLLR